MRIESLSATVYLTDMHYVGETYELGRLRPHWVMGAPNGANIYTKVVCSAPHTFCRCHLVQSAAAASALGSGVFGDLVSDPAALRARNILLLEAVNLAAGH